MGLTDEDHRRLHEVRLRGVVEVGDEDRWAPLLEAGLVACTRGGVRITPEGRAVDDRWARLAPGSEAEQVVTHAYERFLSLNAEFLRICHDWQIRPGGAPNDHRDPRYDWGVIDRLRALDERVAPVVRRAARHVPRFEPYGRRLRSALARVEDGAHEWFASARLDSYHTVWMQLHEELLLALGRSRASETGCTGTPAQGA